jgi:hypothetical protein
MMMGWLTKRMAVIWQAADNEILIKIERYQKGAALRLC